MHTLHFASGLTKTLNKIWAKAYQGAKTNTHTKQNTANNQHGNVHSACQDTGSNDEESSSNNVDRLQEKTYMFSNTEAC